MNGACLYHITFKADVKVFSFWKIKKIIKPLKFFPSFCTQTHIMVMLRHWLLFVDEYAPGKVWDSENMGMESQVVKTRDHSLPNLNCVHSCQVSVKLLRSLQIFKLIVDCYIVQ